MAHIHLSAKKIVGFKENTRIFIGEHSYLISATMDTGNSGIFPTIGADILEEDEETIKFKIQGFSNVHTLEKVGSINPKVGKIKQERPVVQIDMMRIGGKEIKNPYVALADRSFKKTTALINRNLMREQNFLVDPGAEYIASDNV